MKSPLKVVILSSVFACSKKGTCDSPDSRDNPVLGHCEGQRQVQ